MLERMTLIRSRNGATRGQGDGREGTSQNPAGSNNEEHPDQRASGLLWSIILAISATVSHWSLVSLL